MKAVVLGGGIVGSAAAWDLTRRGFSVTVADLDPSVAGRAATVSGGEAATVEVTDVGAVTRLIEGAAAVVSAVPYLHGLELARAAVETGVHYFDFGGNPAVVSSQLTLDAAARAAGIAIVPDGGLAPGLANVLADSLIEQLGPEPVDEVTIRVGGLPHEPEGTLQYGLFFSPHGLVNEYAEPCDVLRDGAPARVEPLTDVEEVAWERWGPLEAFNTSGGTSTMCSRWLGMVGRLDYKTLRYPGHAAAFRAIRQLGLMDEEPVRVAGVTVAPRQVLLHALATHLPHQPPDVVLVRATATATRDGRSVTAAVEMEDGPDEHFSALARTTAFPVTALAALIAEGRVDVRGATAFHRAVDAATLLDELAPVGIEARRVTG